MGLEGSGSGRSGEKRGGGTKVGDLGVLEVRGRERSVRIDVLVRDVGVAGSGDGVG